MIFLTRRETFNAAHRLFREDYSDEKNMEIFGKCSNPNWHGHNYELFVTVIGLLDLQTGMVINLKKLSSLIQENVIEKLDHKNINTEVDFMTGKLASAENLAIAIWDQLSDAIAKHNARLHCVKLCETENNFVEYFGK